MFTIFYNSAFSQCFTIETILVDACGDPEGANEMVTIRANTAIQVDDLIPDWPNNNFLGWCSSPSLTAQLNQSVLSSCGLLLEPPNGEVPAGKKLLIVTSVNMLVAANSFSSLTDTLYIIYQCAGNTSGHFSNLANSTRTLTIDYASTNCTSSQSVSFLPTQLVGGDGGAVYYDLNGNATYFNTGCNAPVPSIFPYWDFPRKICASYGLIDLNTFLPPNALGVGAWSGDIENGHFFNSVGKLGNYAITYSVNDPLSCLPQADSTILFTVEDIKSGNDTVVVCDSINQFGIWITADTLAEILITSSNPYRCDSIIYRYYFINTANYSLAQTQVSLLADESYDFTIIGTNAYTYSYTNTLGNECPSPCTNTTVSPEESTIYVISVTDQSTSCATLLSLDFRRIYISALNYPNTFTPNADGQNDVLKLYGKDLKTVNFKVYSAWGEILFEGKSLNDY